MDEMLEAIRAAVSADATSEQKAVGAQACRTILAALEAQTGKAIAIAGAPQPSPLSGISPEQALDLLIARLSSIAEKQERAPRNGVPASSPLRIALVQPPARRKP